MTSCNTPHDFLKIMRNRPAKEEELTINETMKHQPIK